VSDQPSTDDCAEVPTSLAPAPGITPPPTDAPRHRFLSDAIVARAGVTKSVMTTALNEARTGRRYSEILVHGGAISEDALARIRAEHHRLDHVDLDEFAIDPLAAALLPAETARRFGVLPIATLPNGEVVLATADPENLTDMTGLIHELGPRIVFAIANRSQLEWRLATQSREAGGSASRETFAALERRMVAAERLAAEAAARAVDAERQAARMTSMAATASQQLEQMTDARAAADEIVRAQAQTIRALMAELASRPEDPDALPEARRRGIRRRSRAYALGD
jgi:hypothetical protein